ncbi:MG2 domain-containing protein [Myxococcota bacterium]|nr:MG2 domain-containing protein [Myxococcota bacterium]
MTRTKKVLGGMAFLMGLCALGCLGSVVCLPAYLEHGMLVNTCPDGEVRGALSVNTYGLERGRVGSVEVDLNGIYLDKYGNTHEAGVGRGDVSLVLSRDGRETPLDCEWDDPWRGRYSCPLELPEDLTDGDYLLRVSVDGPLVDDPSVEVKLPLYAPAMAQVMTDRPLYEPGDTLLFRAITLRRNDLAPADDRPGEWHVIDPNGEQLLRERSKGGPWGITESSFPLSDDATPGLWTIRWVSGAVTTDTVVRVEPFTLPRYTVEASPNRTWHKAGDTLSFAGVARYTSGAPVANAEVKVTVSGDGDWPPPTEWLEARELKTDASGRFTLSFGEVPADLIGQASLRVLAVVTDSAGDVQRGQAAATLSKDPVLVDAVTELGDGLAPDFNNRVYLRLTSPDGAPLANRQVTVTNAWAAVKEPKTSSTDADGVLAMQLDPGQPVSLVTPPPPYRPQPRAVTQAVRFAGGNEHFDGRELSYEERVALESVARRAQECGVWAAAGPQRAQVVLELSGDRLVRATSDGSGLGDCVRGKLGALPGDGERMLSVNFTAANPEIPALSASLEDVIGGVARLIEPSLSPRIPLANLCLLRSAAEGQSSRQLVLTARAGSTELSQRWVDSDAGTSWAEAACVAQAIGTPRLSAPATSDGVALVTFDLSQPASARGARPQATVSDGFELTVDVEGVGGTRWRSAPGAVPTLRLRPSAVLLSPGDELELEVLRGPDYSGDLPDTLTIQQGTQFSMTCARHRKALKLLSKEDRARCPEPKDDNRVRFTLPKDRDGFFTAEWGGARTMVYARPASTLSLTMTTDKPVYRPGERGELRLKASSQAVVSVAGVDSTLGTLAPLVAPNALNAALQKVHSDQPAFGLFDALALTSGGVRGEAAAMATILRVSRVDLIDPLSPPVSASASWRAPVDEELLDVFYSVLADARAAVRAWERAAKPDELLTHARAKELWDSTLDAREAAGRPVNDPYGRRLVLHQLNEDLLAKTQPNLLVRDAARLPEDNEPWAAWVQDEDNQ